MTTLSIHGLNTTSGKPASGLNLTVLELDSAETTTQLAAGTTNDDGRYKFDGELSPGTYRVRFDTKGYFGSTETLYPFVEITFEVHETTGNHIHIPLLVSPFGFTTYRGS